MTRNYSNHLISLQRSSSLAQYIRLNNESPRHEIPRNVIDEIVKRRIPRWCVSWGLPGTPFHVCKLSSDLNKNTNSFPFYFGLNISQAVQLADAELSVDPFVQALQVVPWVGHPPVVVLLRRFVQIITSLEGNWTFSLAVQLRKSSEVMKFFCLIRICLANVTVDSIRCSCEATSGDGRVISNLSVTSSIRQLK